jgi:ABC-type nitrate/sulfonate/bicarbonate transport system permease component
MTSRFWNPYSSMSGKTRFAWGLGSFLVVIAVWSAIAMTGWVSDYKLPSPMAVLKALSYLAWFEGKSMLLDATLSSLSRVAMAGIAVVCIGVPFGILLGASPTLNAIFSPILDPFRSAPVVAFLPLFVMWFGIDEFMKVSFLFVGAVVYLIPMVRDAIKAVPSQYYISAQDIGGNQWECIIKALVPMAMPRIADSIIVSVSLMWTYITVAEYVNAGSGLGQLIQNARRFSAMDQVFAGILVIVFVALISHQLMTLAKKKLYPWETQS